MNKRKLCIGIVNNTQNSETRTYSSRMESHSKEKSLNSIDRHGKKSLASIIDIMDNSAKRPISYSSHRNHNRPFFMTKPTSYNGCQYSRRKSADNNGASSSQKVWLRKASTQSNNDTRHHKENKKKSCHRHDRIITCSSVAEAALKETLVCGLCERSLEGKPLVHENAIYLGNLSVVAILVCGHVYHADCLERKTRHEDIRDPICPLCVGRSDVNS